MRPARGLAKRREIAYLGEFVGRVAKNRLSYYEQISRVVSAWAVLVRRRVRTKSEFQKSRYSPVKSADQSISEMDLDYFRRADPL